MSSIQDSLGSLTAREHAYSFWKWEKGGEETVLHMRPPP